MERKKLGKSVKCEFLKRCTMLILAFVLMLFICPMPVSANSPPSAEFAEANLNTGVAILVFIFVSVPGLILTIVSEEIVAAVFRFDLSTRKMIRLTNLVSQILMRVLFVCIHLLLNNYYLSIIAVEILVYFGEYLAYCKIFREITIRKRLLFTIFANTVSLLLGMWMNDWLFL